VLHNSPIWKCGNPWIGLPLIRCSAFPDFGGGFVLRAWLNNYHQSFRNFADFGHRSDERFALMTNIVSHITGDTAVVSLGFTSLVFSSHWFS
jgi:hypothetical protein